MNSSAHANNKIIILVLGEDFIQGIDNRTIYAEKIYSINFTVPNKTFCSSLHYNGDNSYLFVNGKEIINFRAKDSKIISYPLCLGNISEDFDPSNAAKTGLNGYVYDFSVDSWAIAKEVSAKAVVIQSMTHMLNYVFLVLLKT